MTHARTLPRPATLADVAKQVGCSTRTVSRVVNNEPGISLGTRERVGVAVAQLGYRPNLAARRLVTRRSALVGLIVPEFDNPFFPSLAVGVQQACTERAETLVLGQSCGDPAMQASVVESLVSHGVDGLIVLPEPGTDDLLAAVAAAGTPVVVLNSAVADRRLASVMTRFAAGAALAADHLYELGHREVAMIGNATEPMAARSRELGFVTRWSELGGGAVVIERAPHPTVQGGRDAAHRVLAQHPEVTAVFAYNDLIAIGVLRACHESGRSVPQSCTVVGFDDIELAAALSPSLSTVRVDRARVGRTAVDLLGQMQARPHGPAPRAELDTEIQVRETSAPPPVSSGFRAPTRGEGHRSPTGEKEIRT